MCNLQDEPKCLGTARADFLGGGDQQNTLYLFQTGRARCGREMRHN